MAALILLDAQLRLSFWQCCPSDAPIVLPWKRENRTERLQLSRKKLSSRFLRFHKSYFKPNIALALFFINQGLMTVKPAIIKSS